MCYTGPGFQKWILAKSYFGLIFFSPKFFYKYLAIQNQYYWLAIFLTELKRNEKSNVIKLYRQLGCFYLELQEPGELVWKELFTNNNLKHYSSWKIFVLQAGKMIINNHLLISSIEILP